MTATGPIPGLQEVLRCVPSGRSPRRPRRPPSTSGAGGRTRWREPGDLPRARRLMATRSKSWRVMDFAGAWLTFGISCSKGTYVRSLARDIACRLGTCAFVSRLRRTRIGGFRLADAVRPDDFDPGRNSRKAAYIA